MKIFMTFINNVETKVYVNFILIKRFGALGTVRVHITESDGMLVDTLLEN